ncbi:hypothetical protein ACROYT_G028355 [Oculina patagonica]
MAAFRMNRENKKIDVIWSSGIFFLLVANWQFVGSSDTCRWTTPAPAWNQTDLNDIRTVDILVFNRSTHVPLKWNYTLSPGQKLRTTTFSIDGGDIGVIYHGDAGDDITIYQTRFNISRSEVATLIISKATEREEAIYQCKLSTTSVWAYNIRVKLTELQLHWDETPSNLSTVEEGANITLQWTYSYTLGLETPTFRQAKFTDLSDGDGGRPIANKLAGLKLYVEPPYSDWDINIQNTKASMTIFAVHRSQSGRYKFEVETLSNNKLGRLSSIVNVSVQFAANLTNVSRDHTVREGSNIQLFCEASGEPTPNITWTRVLEDGSNSEVLHNRSNWDFLNINRTASGTYRCTADNGIRNPVSHKVKVNVTYPAKIVKLASEYEVAAQQGASLHCQAEGNPQPTYTWTPCEPQNSVCDESTLHISEVLNDGVYTCKVTNYLGSNSKSTSLVIAGTSINVTLVITSESCTDGKYSLSLLWKKLPETIDEIFGSESSYNSTTLLNVRCGSVIVDLALQFRSVVQESKVLLKLKDAAKNGRLGEYRVSASSIVGTRPQTVTTAPTNTNDRPDTDDNDLNTDNMDLNLGTDMDYDNMDTETTNLEFGLDMDYGIERCLTTVGVIHTTVEQSGEEAKVAEKKPKIKWPKANDTATYNQFDEEVSKLVRRFKGTTEERLEKLAEVVYEEGLRRFGLEKEQSPRQGQKKGGPSRRKSKADELRKEKKRLRTLWLNAEEHEKEGLKVLYEQVKRQHRDLMGRERRLSRRKEKKKVRQQFVKNPYKFAKGLFVESKSRKLECAKEELENHLKATYSDPKREDELPRMAGLQKPTSPGVAFDMSDIKMKEVDDFVRKARAKSAPGNNGIIYKVYKKCPLLRNHLFRLLHEMWRKKSVADRWCFAVGIYLPKEENAKGIAQFRTISLLNIDGKILLGIIAKRVIEFVQINGYVNESVQKAGIPANAYGSVPHGLIEMAMENFWFPEPVKAMLMQYYNKFRMRFTTDGFTTNWQRLEVGIAAGCTISVILFVLVMEMILKSTKADIALLRTPLRAFMDDITVLAKSTNAANQILERLDELITWSRMKFKAKK